MGGETEVDQEKKNMLNNQKITASWNNLGYYAKL